ncbi:MAG: hypothetical protein GXO23_04685 [Crenarchaeota archaeon]|nr:hypothetical protein [Thermoproteota archaeon]
MSGSSSTKIVPPNLDRWLESNAAKKEFAEWWSRYSGISTDLVLTRKISTFIAEELELLKILYNITNLSDDILCKVAESWIRLLEKLGINRTSVRRGEIHGLRSEVVSVLKKIFPFLEHYSEPAPFNGFRARELPTSTREVEYSSRREDSYPHYTHRKEYVESSHKRDSDVRSKYVTYNSRRNATILKIAVSIIVIAIVVFLLLLFLSSLYHVCIPMLVSRVIYLTLRSLHTFLKDVFAVLDHVHVEFLVSGCSFKI